MQSGIFVVLEGGEGVGKSTNMAFMQDYLRQHQIDFVHSREPGGTELAEQIRALLLVNRDEKVADMTELLLMFAARAQHLANKIRPTLAQGKWLMCDRFTDATFAYQGGGRGFDQALIKQLETMVQAELRPHCTIILDAPVEVGFARARARASLDRMESEDLAFHQRVRQTYLTRAAEMPDKYAVINADQPLSQVQDDIQRVLDGLIQQSQQSK